MSFAGLETGETYHRITLPSGDHGFIRGSNVVAQDGHIKCRRFCQIPYAYPPVGDLRWRSPRALPDDYKWNGVEGEHFGNIAAQPEYSIKNPEGKVFPTKVKGMDLSEDSLTVNVWTPAGEAPSGGWPVYVYLHGGWLQIGNPAMTDKNNCADLVDEAGVKIVVVAVGYRLGVFGFLASEEIAEENANGCSGNFGFQDQRLGIEWTAKNIHHFGGNSSNITLGGPSAGSYSTHFQLCHEFNFPGTPQLVKRVIMYSNAISVQPKDVEQSQPAFDGVCEAFGISKDSDGKSKMQCLRAVSAEELMRVVMKLKIHTFRAVTDGVFVHRETAERIENGHFARCFKARDMAIVIGEVDKEELLYGATNPPRDLAALQTQLLNYYPESQIAKIRALYPNIPEVIDVNSAEDMAKLQNVYGQMVADGQVYIPSRNLVDSLYREGIPTSKILRYRISWRPKGTDLIALFSPEVTHSDDTWAWWYSKRYGFTGRDCEIAKAWLAPMISFFSGDQESSAKLWWGKEAEDFPRDVKTQRMLISETIVVADDDRWARYLQFKAGSK